MTSDDFEIQEETISITESQFDEAFEKASDEASVRMIKKVLKKELGFMND